MSHPSGRGIPVSVHARRIARAPSNQARQRFLELSVAITGYDDAVLWGTGMVDTYLTFVLDAVGDQVTGRLLSVWHQVADAAQGDPSALDQMLRDEVFADPTLGPVARNLIVLWYLGDGSSCPPTGAIGTARARPTRPHSFLRKPTLRGSSGTRLARIRRPRRCRATGRGRCRRDRARICRDRAARQL